MSSLESGKQLHLPPGSMDDGQLREFATNPRRFVWERYRKHGRILKTNLGAPVVLLAGPDANRAVLSTFNDNANFGKAFPKFLQHLLGGKDATFTLRDHGGEMRGLKQIAQTAFHPDRLSATVEVLNRHIDKGLAESSRAGSVEFFPTAKRIVFRVMWEWLTGAEEGRLQRQVVEDAYARFTRTVQGDLLHRITMDADGEGGEASAFSKQQTAQFVLSALAAQREVERRLQELVAKRRYTSRGDVLGGWVEQRSKGGERLSNDQIVAHALLFLTAGVHTTSGTLSWLIYALDRYPEVWERLRDEVDTVIGDGAFLFEHSRKLPYLLCVLKEVERTYSPSFGPNRVVVKGFDFDGYHVPAGWNLRLCNFVSHYLPEVFKEPERFDPDRFAPPREEDEHTPYSLVGFGGGPRLCAGKPFALLTMMVFAVAIVKGYRLKVPQDDDVSPVLQNRALFVPKSGINVEFTPRSTT